MKKFVLSLVLLLPFSAIASDYGMNVPEWKDFAPKAFVDVEAPKGLGKFNVTAKYWYERKVEFENELSTCQSMDGHEERFTCYENLKVEQYKKNTDYNARIEAQQQAMSSIPEMNNRIDNMLPLNYMNNYTRMMPNELRGY